MKNHNFTRATFNTFHSTRNFLFSVYFGFKFTFKTRCTAKMMLHGGLIKLLLEMIYCFGDGRVLRRNRGVRRANTLYDETEAV